MLLGPQKTLPSKAAEVPVTPNQAGLARTTSSMCVGRIMRDSMRWSHLFNFLRTGGVRRMRPGHQRADCRW